MNGEHFDDKVKAIQKIEEIGASYAIGRDANVGDTIIGIKGRVGFEAAAPKLIIEAHRLLEKSTLSKWQQYWKDRHRFRERPDEVEAWRIWRDADGLDCRRGQGLHQGIQHTSACLLRHP